MTGLELRTSALPTEPHPFVYSFPFTNTLNATSFDIILLPSHSIVTSVFSILPEITREMKYIESACFVEICGL